MSELSALGRGLILAGGVLLLVGVLLTLAGRVPGIGRLAGDIVYRSGSLTFYFPLATSILLGVLLTLVLSWLRRR
jgi:hypothetical protein